MFIISIVFSDVAQVRCVDQQRLQEEWSALPLLQSQVPPGPSHQCTEYQVVTAGVRALAEP